MLHAIIDQLQSLPGSPNFYLKFKEFTKSKKSGTRSYFWQPLALAAGAVDVSSADPQATNKNEYLET